MARARSIKPDFFIDERVVELPYEYRILFIGLWTLADRAGRLEDKPKRIKMAVFPGDNVDIEAGLVELHRAGLIVRYQITHENRNLSEAAPKSSGASTVQNSNQNTPQNGLMDEVAPELHGANTVQAYPADSKRYIQIANFEKHQHVHVNERQSTIPAPGKHGANPSLIFNLSSVTLNPEVGAKTEIPEKEEPTSEAPPPEIYIAKLYTAFEEKLGLKKLSHLREWNELARFGIENGFSLEEVLECHSLLTNQTWRTTAVTAKHIAENLPNLQKLRSGAKDQNGETDEEYLPSPAEKLALIEQQNATRIPPPAEPVLRVQGPRQDHSDNGRRT
jgi:hypothetical protein